MTSEEKQPRFTQEQLDRIKTLLAVGAIIAIFAGIYLLKQKLLPFGVS